MIQPGVDTTPTSSGQPPIRPIMLALLLTATFMAQFDFFVVNVAAPSVRQDLRAGDAGLELIVGGYAFAYAAALVLGGRLGDLFGHRRLFVSGMLGFAATSAFCGLARTPGELIVARLCQGLAAAMMLPQVLAVISRSSAPSRRLQAMAWYGVAGGAGSIAGQVLGGFLVTADVAGLGWRLIFLVTVPIGLAGAIASRYVLPASTVRPRTRTPGQGALDPIGALGFALSLALLLVPLTLGRAEGWPWWTWVSMTAAIPIMAATLRWQKRLSRHGGSPLLDLRLLRARSFRRGILANSAFMAFFAAYMFTLALLLQSGLGLDAFHAGLVFAPAGLAFAVTALLAPRLSTRYGPSSVVAGCLIAVAGLVALAALTVSGDRDTSVAWIVVLAALISAGNGLVLPSLVANALVDVDPAHAGAAAGTLATAQQFSAAVGVAALGTVFFAAAGHWGSVTAMTWSALIGALLVLAVAALTRRDNRARPGDPRSSETR